METPGKRNYRRLKDFQICRRPAQCKAGCEYRDTRQRHAGPFLEKEAGSAISR
jgi:hypothetical protein